MSSPVQPPAPYATPPPGYGPPPPKRGLSCWVVGLIVLAVSVPLLGVLSALAIYGMRRYLAAAKTAEAKATVASIAAAGQSAFERRSTETGDTSAQALCGTALPVPGAVPSGTKYASAPGDWEHGDDTRGWKCLWFSIATPQYYQYHYARGTDPSGSVEVDGDGFAAIAVGDLDADGVHSVFAKSGRVAQGTLEVDVALQVESEFE